MPIRRIAEVDAREIQEIERIEGGRCRFFGRRDFRTALNGVLARNDAYWCDDSTTPAKESCDDVVAAAFDAALDALQADFNLLHGDALAVALLDARGFKAEDFARSHPGGSLGRRLLTHVSDVMRSGEDSPSVLPQASLMELMREMSHKGLGASAVVDAQHQVLGIFTDGDLRRLIEQGRDLRDLKAQDVMHPGPRTIRQDALAVEAAELMEAHRITSVLVVDAAGRLCGALNSNDLMRAKVI